MQVDKLELTNFRNFPKLDLHLSPGLNLLIGPNAQGKTNLLEALHFLTTTRSFRGSRDGDLVYFGASFGRVAGGEVEILLQPGEKTLKLRGKPSRAAEVLGTLRSVLFSPEDMALLSGPPQGRRAHLDELISRIDRKYLLSLISYYKTLKQRNKLLWQVREGRAGEGELASWDELLIRDGAQVLLRRGEVVSRLQEELDKISPSLFNGQKVKLKYLSKVSSEDPSESGFKGALAQALSEARPAEINAATSLVGPHRDDWEATLAGRNLGRFGSRGEQRAAILALKISEVSLNEAETGERPVLLLDDVLSELDGEHQARLLKEVDKQQTILSATSVEFFPMGILSQAAIFKVALGTIERVPRKEASAVRAG